MPGQLVHRFTVSTQASLALAFTSFVVGHRFKGNRARANLIKLRASTQKVLPLTAMEQRTDPTSHPEQTLETTRPTTPSIKRMKITTLQGKTWLASTPKPALAPKMLDT